MNKCNLRNKDARVVLFYCLPLSASCFFVPWWHHQVLECPTETESKRLDVWSSLCRHLNKPPSCTQREAAHQICLSVPQLEARWVISQSSSPRRALCRGRPAHVSQIIVIEQGCSRVWGDLSLHPLPASFLSLFFLSVISAHVVKWPESIFFSLPPPFPLTLPVTQKSISSFQVRSKAQYTVQSFPKPPRDN